MESSEFNFSGDNATAQTLNNFHGEFQNINEMNLSDEMVVNAIERACDFFHLPKVPVYNAESSCVWPNEPTTTYDDAFGYNRQELMNLGINGEDSLTLIYTHECAHRALQSYKNLDSWEHELACDFFSGIHAGMKGIDAQNVCESLGKTHGSLTHPTGTLRADFIEYGIEVAKDMDARKIPITVESCLERFNQHLIAKDDNIMECKNAINEPFAIINADDFYGRNSFVKAYQFLSGGISDKEFGLIGYRACNTITENGSVKRGVCEIENGVLTGINESSIEKVDEHIHCKSLVDGKEYDVELNRLVSMNMLLFTPKIFDYLENDFVSFLNNINDKEKDEFLIPEVVDEHIKSGDISVKVIETDSVWYGVTYKEDKESVKSAINNLINSGEYNKNLW